MVHLSTTCLILLSFFLLSFDRHANKIWVFVQKSLLLVVLEHYHVGARNALFSALSQIIGGLVKIYHSGMDRAGPNQRWLLYERPRSKLQHIRGAYVCTTPMQMSRQGLHIGTWGGLDAWGVLYGRDHTLLTVDCL